MADLLGDRPGTSRQLGHKICCKMLPVLLLGAAEGKTNSPHIVLEGRDIAIPRAPKQLLILQGTRSESGKGVVLGVGPLLPTR